jgi:hypothetical protein
MAVDPNKLAIFQQEGGWVAGGAGEITRQSSELDLRFQAGQIDEEQYRAAIFHGEMQQQARDLAEQHAAAFIAAGQPGLPGVGGASIGGGMALQFSNGLIAASPSGAGSSWTSPETITSLAGLGMNIASLFMNRGGGQPAGSMNQVPVGGTPGAGTITGPIIGEVTRQVIDRGIDWLTQPPNIAPANPYPPNSLVRRLMDPSLPVPYRYGKPPGLRARNRQRAGMGLPPLKPRMNVANVHALRRAMRRVGGFANLAKSTMTFAKTHHMKKRGRKR